MDYQIYVFEVDRPPFPIKGESDAANLVMRLRKEEDENPNLPPDPRFVRLGKRLVQLLPDEEHKFWLNRPDFTLSSCGRIWQPDIKEWDQVETLLKVLLPLARELHLGVFDAMLGIYLPPGAKQMPLPQSKEALGYRVAYDPGFLEMEQFTQETLDAHVVEILVPILAKHGFTQHPQYPCRYQRKINGGFQKVYAVAMSSSPLIPLILDVGFEQYSDRIAAIRTKYDNFGSRFPELRFMDTLGKTFGFTLQEFRESAYPVWKNFGAWASRLALTREDVDWIIDDILQVGLPFLDRFRTFSVDDADRYFNEHDESAGEPYEQNSFYARLYARLAGKRDFEAVVRRFDRDWEDPEDKEGYEQMTDLIRREIHPVDGSEPA